MCLLLLVLQPGHLEFLKRLHADHYAERYHLVICMYAIDRYDDHEGSSISTRPQASPQILSIAHVRWLA